MLKKYIKSYILAFILISLFPLNAIQADTPINLLYREIISNIALKKNESESNSEQIGAGTIEVKEKYTPQADPKPIFSGFLIPIKHGFIWHHTRIIFKPDASGIARDPEYIQEKNFVLKDILDVRSIDPDTIEEVIFQYSNGGRVTQIFSIKDTGAPLQGDSIVLGRFASSFQASAGPAVTFTAETIPGPPSTIVQGGKTYALVHDSNVITQFTNADVSVKYEYALQPVPPVPIPPITPTPTTATPYYFGTYIIEMPQLEIPNIFHVNEGITKDDLVPNTGVQSETSVGFILLLSGVVILFVRIGNELHLRKKK